MFVLAMKFATLSLVVEITALQERGLRAPDTGVLYMYKSHSFLPPPSLYFNPTCPKPYCVYVFEQL